MSFDLAKVTVICPLCAAGVVGEITADYADAEIALAFGDRPVTPRVRWSCSYGCQITVCGHSARRFAQYFAKALKRKRK